MPKKPFVKPMIIDLSMQGTTGRGANSCGTGAKFIEGPNASCAEGQAAAGECNLGSSFGLNCLGGNNPNSYDGPLCAAGSEADSACQGGTTPAFPATCYEGTEAEFAPGMGLNCESGSNAQDLCLQGNGQAALS